jgi:hypothetical protein
MSRDQQPGAPSLEVRIRVEKAGFEACETTVRLPHGCRRVRGKIEAAPAVGVASHPVAHARCTAALRLDGSAWSSEVTQRSGARDGAFQLDLPRSLVHVFGAGAEAYDLPRALALDLGDDSQRALGAYESARADLEAELRGFPAGIAYDAPLARCADYPAQLVRLLSSATEEEAPLAMSGLHRLRCSLLLARRYRRDLRLQRELLESALRDSLGTLADAIADLLAAAMRVLAWVRGETIRPGAGKESGELVGLPSLLERATAGLDAGILGRPLPRLLRETLDGARLALAWADAALSRLLDEVARFAREAGFASEWYLGGVAAAGAAPAAASAGGADGGTLEALGGPFDGLARLGLRLACALFQAACALLATALRLSGSGIAAMPWRKGAAEGWGAATGEVVERFLADLATAVYDGSGLLLADAISGLPRRDGTQLSGRMACRTVMDALAPLSALDANCAPQLEAAYQRSLACKVELDWEAAQSRVSEQERVDRARCEAIADRLCLVDRGAPFAQAVVGLVQAAVFVWARLGDCLVAAVAPRATRTLRLLLPVERTLDALELTLVRLPIVATECVRYALVYLLAPRRMRALYGGPGA